MSLAFVRCVTSVKHSLAAQARQCLLLCLFDCALLYCSHADYFILHVCYIYL